jgi:hypothetical protein
MIILSHGGQFISDFMRFCTEYMSNRSLTLQRPVLERLTGDEPAIYSQLKDEYRHPGAKRVRHEQYVER